MVHKTKQKNSLNKIKVFFNISMFEHFESFQFYRNKKAANIKIQFGSKIFAFFSSSIFEPQSRLKNTHL